MDRLAASVGADKQNRTWCRARLLDLLGTGDGPNLVENPFNVSVSRSAWDSACWNVIHQSLGHLERIAPVIAKSSAAAPGRCVIQIGTGTSCASPDRNRNGRAKPFHRGFSGSSTARSCLLTHRGRLSSSPAGPSLSSQHHRYRQRAAEPSDRPPQRRPAITARHTRKNFETFCNPSLS